MNIQVAVRAQDLEPGDEIEDPSNHSTGIQVVGKVIAFRLQDGKAGIWFKYDEMPTGYGLIPDLILDPDLQLVIWRYV